MSEKEKADYLRRIYAMLIALKSETAELKRRLSSLERGEENG